MYSTGGPNIPANLDNLHFDCVSEMYNENLIKIPTR